MQEEIKARIIAEYKYIRSGQNTFLEKLRYKYIKLINKRQIVLYGSETWTLIKVTEQNFCASNEKSNQ